VTTIPQALTEAGIAVDDSALYFSAGTQLWRLDLAGGDPRALGGVRDNCFPSDVVLDSKAAYFVQRCVDGRDSAALFRVPKEGGTTVALTGSAASIYDLAVEENGNGKGGVDFVVATGASEWIVQQVWKDGSGVDPSQAQTLAKASEHVLAIDGSSLYYANTDGSTTTVHRQGLEDKSSAITTTARSASGFTMQKMLVSGNRVAWLEATTDSIVGGQTMGPNAQATYRVLGTTF
jgi:hypothetical protein